MTSFFNFVVFCYWEEFIEVLQMQVDTSANSNYDVYSDWLMGHLLDLLYGQRTLSIDILCEVKVANLKIKDYKLS